MHNILTRAAQESAAVGRLEAGARRVDATIEGYCPGRSPHLAIARTLIAIAQLSILWLTPQKYFFVPVAGREAGPKCDEYNRWTAYCLSDSAGWQSTVPWVLSIILIAVLTGFFPRVVSWFHVWASYSVSTAIALPDGGEVAAQLFSVYIAVICLGDSRRNHWSKFPEPGNGWLQSISWAGSVVLRVQVFWIYISASVAKFSVDSWGDGSAIYYVTRQEFFGVSGPLQSVVEWVTRNPYASLGLTWGSMILELGIALLMLTSYRYRRWAIPLTIAFHGGIILIIGLWSFGLIMIAGVVASLTGGRNRSQEAPVMGGQDGDGDG